MRKVLHTLFLVVSTVQVALGQSATCPKIHAYCVTTVPDDAVICGGSGVLKAPSNSVDHTCFKSFSDCRNICFADPKCQSFVYNSERLLCKLYSTPAKAGKEKHGPKGSSLWDKRCFSYQKLDMSSLVFASRTDGEDNNMYPAFADRHQESVVILGPESDASIFAINHSSGTLSTTNSTGGKVVANQNAATFGQELYFNPPSEVKAGGYVSAVCNIDSVLTLHCNTRYGRKVMFDDGGVVALARPTDAAGYPTLALVAACPTASPSRSR